MKIKSFGPVDERAKQQLERCASEAVYAVLCADHHPGYSLPIGGAVAYEHFISPSGVGYDIGCGNKAVRTNLKAAEVDVSSVMDEIVSQIGFGIGRPNPDPVDHPVLQKIANAEFKDRKSTRLNSSHANI